MEFDVARVLVEAESGRSISDELIDNGALAEAEKRGLVRQRPVLTAEGQERLYRMRQLFAPA